jgi:hypothetical protein
MRGEARTSLVADPGPLGVAIPDDIQRWAAEHGWGPANPDVWIAVAPEDPVRGAVDGEVAWRDGTVPDEDLAAIGAQLKTQG